MLAILRDTFNFLFPHRCALCGNLLGGSETSICAGCLMGLPLYRCTDYNDNELARLLWKRLPLVRATAFLQYHPDTRSNWLITGPKYLYRDDIAWSVGTLIATHLAPKGFFDNIDIIVPMPTTTKRRDERGMNQVEEMARALAHTLSKRNCKTTFINPFESKTQNAPVLVADAVRRVHFGKSQTLQTHYERITAVTPDCFRVVKPECLRNRHILLFDDVVTTGASMASLGQAITNAVSDVRISVLSVSRASTT